MFWADKLLEGRSGEELINDSWTPSGIVHMGSLKGPVIHDVLHKIVKEKRNARFIYGFDDADPIDGLPPDLADSHNKYLGVPLFMVPSPDGKGTFGEFFGNKMENLLAQLGIKPEIYRTSDLYKNGTFNTAIAFVLDHALGVRKVYEDMYGKKLASNWYPLQVVCPHCGKVGTTKVTAWDGKEVTYSCEETLVRWAKGCGAEGKMSPFDGRAKMPYKVEWAAKWWTWGVTIEGAGKDHLSAGGTYDIARKILQDVFGAKPPLSFAYEFFLSGGKKMSSSKGLGLTGQELLDTMPPQLVRLLMIKTPPNQAVEFTPYNTDAIPNVYDAYQTIANARDNDSQRIFHLSQVNGLKKPPKIRFSVLAQWVQMPNMEEQIKKEGLEEWAKYARIWVEKYAPESERFFVQKKLPVEVKKLSEKQKEYLKKIALELDKKMEAEEFQTHLYNCAKELGLSPKEAFAAIYIALLGKDHGPKAAWLILSLERRFVKDRLNVR